LRLPVQLQLVMLCAWLDIRYMHDTTVILHMPWSVGNCITHS